MSVHHVGEEGNARLGWRLYLPESWANDEQRRLDAGIPADVVFRPKWELALDIIDQLAAGAWRIGGVADAGYGELLRFGRNWSSANCAMRGSGNPHGSLAGAAAPTQLKPKQTGRPPTASHYGKQRPVAVKDAAQQAQGWKKVRWREGSKGRLESRFWAARVQPSHGFHEGRNPGKEVWLLVEWPEEAAEPTRYFFCDLSADYSLRRFVQVAKAAGRSSRTINNSRRNSGWITMKVAVGTDGTTT